MILSSHLATLHQTHFPCLAIGVGFVGCEITGAWRVSFISVPLVPVEEIRGMCITNVVGVFMSMMFSGYFRPRKRTESERRRVFISRVERWGPGGALTRLILSNGLSTIKTRDWLHVKSEGRCQGYSSWRGGLWLIWLHCITALQSSQLERRAKGARVYSERAVSSWRQPPRCLMTPTKTSITLSI